MVRVMLAILPIVAIVSYVTCIPTAQLASHDVERRAATVNNVEVLFVLDKKAFQVFVKEESTTAAAKASAEKEIDYYVTQLNGIFASLAKNNLNVKISKRGLLILDSDIFTSGTINDDNADAAGGLNDFDAWLAKQNAQKTYNYDHALLFTGWGLNDKKTGNTAPAGLAWVDSICGAKASSINEFTGTYDSVLTAAHEIGHNLGADHDGQATGYVMTPEAMPKSKNRWDFSLKSASDITGAIKRLNENCMKTTNPASTMPEVGPSKSLASLDATCKRIYGPKSYMCHDPNLYKPAGVPKGDALCDVFFCNEPGIGMCHSAASSEGTLCGSGKTCQRGSCKDDPKAPTGLDDNCLFGDSPSLNINGEEYTCASAIDTYTKASICGGDPFFVKMCCASCKGSATAAATTTPSSAGATAGTTGASSGGTCAWEMYDNCSEFDLGWVCNSEHREGCCKTCANYKPSSKRDVSGSGKLSKVLGAKLKKKKLNFTENKMDPEDIEKHKKLEKLVHKQMY